MTCRLQVIIQCELEAKLRKQAQRVRVSKGEWVRRALQEAVDKSAREGGGRDPLERLAQLGGPAADIGQMLREIEAGRS